MRLKTLIPAVVVYLCAFAMAQGGSEKLPLTASSAQAKSDFQRGMTQVENLRTDLALASFKSAAKRDPNFALAQLFISYITKDPFEESAARAKAKGLASKASAGEQLEIRWLAGIRENDLVPAIAAMNDLLAQYPRDKQLFFLAGRWLILEEQYEPGERMLEKALAIDSNYAAALNEIAYAYAFTRNFDKAFAAMERYVKLLPGEPNPQDSYGELSRMGGRFQASLDHYRAALKIDPKFFTSQLGLGDTDSLMGESDQARIEYNKAAQMADNPSDAVDATTQWAISYVREKQFAQADMAMGHAAERAHTAGLAQKEAAAHRMMAMYQERPEDQLKHLEAAEAVLTEKHDAAASDVEQERARILRWKAAPSMLALKNGKDVTSKALAALEKMASSSTDVVVQRQYHAAAGIMLAHDGKFAAAIPHLEEDVTSPFSQLVLLNAYLSTGDKVSAAAVQKKLIGWNEPTMEQALVVPAFRAALGKATE
jgi:tetratricopeptide (TPR) repeat protein